MGATSAAGLQLSAELAPLMEVCAPTPAAEAIESAGPAAEAAQGAAQEAAPSDEDDAMADRAGLAAAAQDPRHRVQRPAAPQPLMGGPAGERLWEAVGGGGGRGKPGLFGWVWGEVWASPMSA